MELRELRSLVALADLGGIARASEKLHLSAPAIHKQLKLLEAELGVRLYQKIGRSLRLTQAAEILLPYSRELLAGHDGAIAALQEWKGLERGIVRVGAGPATSVYLLPDLLREYRRAYPKVDLVIETGNSPSLIEKLGNGSLDLALMVSSQLPEEPNLFVEQSWDMQFVLVCNLPNVPRRCKISELKNFSFILFRKGSRMQNAIERYFNEMDFHPAATMAFDNADAIKAMLRAGLGISLLPFWIVGDDVKNGALTMIRQRECPLFSKLELVRRKSTYTPGPVAAFVELTRVHSFKKLRLLSR
jgi:DNA-binding transcriptional LysR family regulator